jgi:hypothetical protein
MGEKEGGRMTMYFGPNEWPIFEELSIGDGFTFNAKDQAELSAFMAGRRDNENRLNRVFALSNIQRNADSGGTVYCRRVR